MFDKNDFKKSVKNWIQEHKDLDAQKFEQYCLSLIPATDLKNNQWLVEQSVSWFKFIQEQRTAARTASGFGPMQ